MVRGSRRGTITWSRNPEACRRGSGGIAQAGHLEAASEGPSQTSCWWEGSNGGADPRHGRSMYPIAPSATPNGWPVWIDTAARILIACPSVTGSRREGTASLGLRLLIQAGPERGETRAALI